MDGVLVVDKPLGLTSMRVVERVRRLARERKAGHAGTLDPAASGVLPVCLGRGTKLVPYLQGGDKEYLATVRLGVETDTYDLDGQVTAEAEVPPLSAEALAPHLDALTGDIMQRPPAYSALRVGGERLYDKARRGEAVEPEPRPVTVHSLELLSLEPPDLELRVRCGKGTYIRSLAVDLGRAIGCGGALAALCRSRVGTLDLSRSITMEQLEALSESHEVQSAVLSLADAVAHLPTARLLPTGVARILQGQAVTAEHLEGEAEPAEAGTPVRLLDDGGALVAIAEPRDDQLRPRRVLATG